MKAPLIIILVVLAAALAVALWVAVIKLIKCKQSQKIADKDKTTSSDDGEPSTTKESFGFGLSYSGIAALTAILIPLGLWFGLRAGLNLFGGREEAPVMLTLV